MTDDIISHRDLRVLVALPDPNVFKEGHGRTKRYLLKGLSF